MMLLLQVTKLCKQGSCVQGQQEIIIRLHSRKSVCILQRFFLMIRYYVSVLPNMYKSAVYSFD